MQSLPVDVAAWARAAIKAKGLKQAASELDLPRHVLLVAAAEAPIRRGTLDMVSRRFREKTEVPAPKTSDG